MVLLHKRNELKIKYKLLRKLRLYLIILIKNEEKKIHHLDVSQLFDNSVLNACYYTTSAFQALMAPEYLPRSLHFCSTKCILSLQRQTHNLYFLLNFVKNTM